MVEKVGAALNRSLPNLPKQSRCERMIHGLKCIDRRHRKVWRRPTREPAEQDDALLIGDRRHRLDHAQGWRLAQYLLEHLHRLGVAHAAQCAGGLDAYVAVEVAEQVGKCRDDLRSSTCQPACAGPDRGIRLAEQCEHDFRRQMRSEPRGGGHRDGQCRPLHPATADAQRYAPRGVRPADRGERFQRGNLLGDRMLHAKAGEAAAIVLEYRNDSDEPASAGFRCQGWAVRDP